ncbi:hypothetical protein G5C51_09355 [Streptomyces sp. A7024]|uniref:Uncharacterized protein n=1 Tax=Streptomyces coryli TaxID=1128680 RepID=A0A6G4TVT0_9ACTN|nr:hypothetical protein [Streptomyces coryli]NGN64109.1 hypothetical protein [Streptomyces coryli]
MNPHLKPPAHHAEAAAEAVRALNHTTQARKDGFDYPSDAYEVVGPLNQLAMRLPQSFAQLSSFLVGLSKAGAVTADHGEAKEHLGDACSALASSALIAQTLAEHLERAHSALSPLGYDTSDEEEPCGEGMCICYCVGARHPCGCDCPHDEDCDCPFCWVDD